MHNGLIQVGVAITFLQTAILIRRFFRRQQQSFALYGWFGLVGLVCAETLLFTGFRPVTVYFTPMAWTCYILVVDAAVLATRGDSRLHDYPKQFALLALLSIPLWLIFEAYNLRLQNWTYVGVPHQWALALLGYGWSFATIIPAIFETADLIESFGGFHRAPAFELPRVVRASAIVFGAICLLLPLVVPQDIARRWFLLIWVGFIFFLDPVNDHLGLPSLLRDFRQGYFSRFYSLLWSGFVCGWYWEFWNYWAAAKWYYIFPMFQHCKVFEMPLPGYLGFLPFALECFVMFVTSSSLLSLLRRS